MPKVGGLERGPVGGGANNAVRRSVLASSMLGVSAINSRILSQVPWKPRGYSNPFVSTHRNHNRAIRLHSLASSHTCSYDLISCCTNSFLSTRVDGSAACSTGSIACHGPLGVPNLALSERLFLAPLAHPLQLLEIPPIPYKKRDNSRVVHSLGALARRSPQSTCPF